MPNDAAHTGFTFTDGPPPETTDETVARLAALPPIEYDKVRVAEAERMGIRTPTLDKQVEPKQRKAEGETPSGRPVLLVDHKPWLEPVATDTLLDELVAAIQRHLIVPPSAIDAVSLWIVHTWIYERFDYTPRLAITSPTKRCGKSTLLDVLRATCRRTLKADNISASGIFRTVESLAPLTLLIDEADSFLVENDELRGVLNSGFERSGAVIRVVETRGEHQPVQFATFAPVALAAIGTLPGTLADRSVPIRLERKAAADVVTKLREGRSRATLSDLGRKIARWSGDHGGNLSTNPAIPAAMGDREGDICVPLLAIADHAGMAWAARGRRALLALFSLAADAETSAENGVLLLGDVRTIFQERGAERIPSVDLCEALGKMETRPWPEWKTGKPITPTQIARVLKPFKVYPGTYRPPGGAPVKGYQCDHFAEAWERYLSSPAAQGVSEPLHGNSADYYCNSTDSEPVTCQPVLPTQIHEKYSLEQQRYSVTSQSPPNDPEGEAEGEL